MLPASGGQFFATLRESTSIKFLPVCEDWEISLGSQKDTTYYTAIRIEHIKDISSISVAYVTLHKIA